MCSVQEAHGSPCVRLWDHLLEPCESDFSFYRAGSSVLWNFQHVRDSSKLARIQYLLLSPGWSSSEHGSQRMGRIFIKTILTVTITVIVAIIILGNASLEWLLWFLKWVLFLFLPLLILQLPPSSYSNCSSSYYYFYNDHQHVAANSATTSYSLFCHAD